MFECFVTLINILFVETRDNKLLNIMYNVPTEKNVGLGPPNIWLFKIVEVTQMFGLFETTFVESTNVLLKNEAKFC